MKLNHIALNIDSEGDVLNFYQNILGFQFQYSFEMTAELSKKLFNIEKNIQVINLKKNTFSLELFVHPSNTPKAYEHICIEVNNRELISTKCQKEKYPLIRIKRPNKHDLLFVKDRAGNTFELKNIIE